ncbi:amino acid ABC transporter ATP-binding protein [Halorhabdus amylolytica]|uniref:amino acid ABC transporter ATP-binding protein n=1 Tax=Halorhabdus amylolytica TaxID=2559573 RepID=UPI0010AA3DAC|nr:amino acid ABC transporter ATP-binding protein [Halorhabdus amylolytica]
MTLLELEDIEKAYENEEVLHGVSLGMEQGDVEVLVGPSGAGKSTLLRCVNRLTEIDAGTIRLAGESIHDLDSNDLRQRVGMVFQDFNLFAHRTARGNVTLGLEEVLGMDHDEAVERAEAHLDQVGLAEQADSYPAELSGGQQQRVGIARALAMDPELMLFDEPTSSLDPELIGDVLAVMNDLAAEGMTMLCVTHEMGFARSAADTLTMLDGGRIVERGPPERLFENPQHERTESFLGQFTDFE